MIFCRLRPDNLVKSLLSGVAVEYKPKIDPLVSTYPYP